MAIDNEGKGSPAKKENPHHDKMKNIIHLWKDARKEFPPFDKEVLGYYEIEPKKGEKERRVYKYYVICHLTEIRKRRDYEYAEWADKELNPVSPIIWTELPEVYKKPNLKK